MILKEDSGEKGGKKMMGCRKVLQVIVGDTVVCCLWKKVARWIMTLEPITATKITPRFG